MMLDVAGFSKLPLKKAEKEKELAVGKDHC